MKVRKALLLSLMFALVFSVLVACSGQNNADNNKDSSSVNNTDKGNTAAPENADSVYTAPFENGKYTDEITMSTVAHLASSITFKDGEDINDNYHTRWAKERFNINLEYLWTTTGQSDTFSTKVRLMLAANEKMPDVIMIRGNTPLLHELIDSGRFMEVGDLFDTHASDTWKNAMNDIPTAWYETSRDGKRFGIPVLNYSYNNDSVMWIRQDWLDNLNLQAPTTLDELEAVMDAFANQDPDKNGKKDTLALATALKPSGTNSGMVNYMGDVSWVFGAFGGNQIPGQWNLTPEGTLKYGSVEPAAKDALALIKKWMDNGYISKEAGLLDQDQAAADFTSGKAGIIFGAHWMPGWPLNELEKNVPGAQYDVYELPVGPDNKVGRKMGNAIDGALLISKDFAHPDAFFVYQNYLFDHFADPSVGGEFEHGFAEGYDWINDNGTPRALAGGEGKITVNKYTLMGEGARIPALMMNTLQKLHNGEEAVTPYENIMKTGRHPLLHKAGYLILEQQEASYPNMFVGSPTATMSSRWDFLKTTENETFTKIIYGEMPLDQFDKFVETWNSSGGEKVTAEVNEWYDSVK